MKVLKESNKYRDFEWKDELYAVIKNDGTFAGAPCRSYAEASQLAYHPGSKIFKLVLDDNATEEPLEEDYDPSENKVVNFSNFVYDTDNVMRYKVTLSAPGYKNWSNIVVASSEEEAIEECKYKNGGFGVGWRVIKVAPISEPSDRQKIMWARTVLGREYSVGNFGSDIAKKMRSFITSLDTEPVEEDLASDIRKGRLNKAYQDEHGANFDAEDDNHYIQFQDHEMHTHEVNTSKDRWGNTYMTGFKNRHPRVSSQSWGRAWDKRTGEITQFSGPKYKVRADMAKYLDSKNSVTESIEDTEQVIIGFDGKGGRKYYNDDTKEWKDTAKEATVFKGTDAARGVWFKLDKKPFKRVFIANNDDNI